MAQKCKFQIPVLDESECDEMQMICGRFGHIPYFFSAASQLQNPNKSLLNLMDRWSESDKYSLTLVLL